MDTTNKTIAPVKLPRIDLGREFIVHLCLKGMSKSTDVFLDIVDEDSGVDNSEEIANNVKAFASIAKYRRRPIEIAITESVAVSVDDSDSVASWRIAYDVNDENGPYPMGNPPKFLIQEGVAFGRILTIARLGIRVTCHVEFLFPPLKDGTGTETEMRLPIRPSGDAERAFFDEIRSVRGVKLDANERDRARYTFTLTRLQSQDITLSLFFPYTTDNGSTMIAEIIDRASEIAQSMVKFERRTVRP